MLSLVEELLSGYGCGSSNHTQSHFLFVYLFPYLYLRLKSTLIQLSKQNHIPPKEQKTTVASLHKFKPLFSVTTLHTTSPAPLYYSTASVSLPVPLSAPNRLSRSTTSVSNGPPEWKLTMKFQTNGPRPPKLTPTIALSVVSTMFAYNIQRLMLSMYRFLYTVEALQ